MTQTGQSLLDRLKNGMEACLIERAACALLAVALRCSGLQAAKGTRGVLEQATMLPFFCYSFPSLLPSFLHLERFVRSEGTCEHKATREVTELRRHGRHRCVR